MMKLTMSTRSTVVKVARWLASGNRRDDAVSLLCSMAARGPNDADGQDLLAEALRLDPAARIAQLAFERMEGIGGKDHRLLEDAIAVWTPEEVERLDKQIARPNYIRAQVGFNNNVKYSGHIFHIQTEDSGLDRPHIITHLFVDGGRIIKSHKRTYAAEVDRPDVVSYVRTLMKRQHMEMAIFLREGRFDEVIAGRAMGGVETLEHEPHLELQKLATKKEMKAEATIGFGAIAPVSPRETLPRDVGESGAKARFRLTVLRSVVGGPEAYEPVGDLAVLGTAGSVRVAGERFCHPRQAEVRWDGGRIWLRDLEQSNGVFLRIRQPVELEIGDEFVVGDQLLSVDRNPDADDGPGQGPIYFYSSPKWDSSFRVVQLFEGGAKGACVVARGTTMQIGSAIGDFVFTGDPLVDDQHCLIEEQAGSIVLTDLDSRSGVFVRVKGEQELVHGDEIIIGRTRLALEAV